MVSKADEKIKKYDEAELREYLEEATPYELITSAIKALYQLEIDRDLIFYLLSKARNIAMQSEFHVCLECGKIIPNKEMKFFEVKYDDGIEEIIENWDKMIAEWE